MAGLFVGALACMLVASIAQAQTSPKMKMTTEIPAGIAIPDTVGSRLGTLTEGGDLDNYLISE
jgi:hypothetical protein